MKRIATVLLAVLASSSQAQNSKIPVYFEADGGDQVGRQLIYSIREQIRSSGGMRLVLTEKEAVYQVRLVTLMPDATPGMTVYSVVWTMRFPSDDLPSFVTQTVGICGRDRIDSCAQSVLAATDEMVTTNAKALTELFDQAAKELPASQK